MSDKITNPAFHILLVEDNASEAKLAQLAVTENNLQCTMNYVNDGEAALMYLMKDKQYATAVLPDLILIDINLPKVSGIELLKEIKTHDTWKRIPVVMLSSSAYEKDIIESY